MNTREYYEQMDLINDFYVDGWITDDERLAWLNFINLTYYGLKG